MKRFLIAVVLVASSLGIVQAQDVDNFVINDFQVQMELSRDDQQRSTLRTTETITATFPDFDQNHGLERVMVREFNDHPTNFKLLSVTDGSGNELSHHWSGDALRIGDADRYVYGQQTYQISYTQRDVTRFFEDTNLNEFYWDAIGVEWRVPIEKVAIAVDVDDSLVSAILAEPQCYRGTAGSTDSCTVTTDGPGSYRVDVADLRPGQGVTVALGFAPDTFVAYQPSLFDYFIQYFVVAQFVSMGVMVLTLGWFVYRFMRKKMRTEELKPIAPFYAPPSDSSVTMATQLVTPARNLLGAQLVDLAVRGYINLHQLKEKRLFRAAEYEIEVTKDPSDLLPEEQELLKDTFGTLPGAGSRLDLASLKNNSIFQHRLSDNSSKFKNWARANHGLQAKDAELKQWLSKNAKRLAWLGLLTITLPTLVGALVVYLMSLSSWKLTDKGLAQKRHLLGLKDYISMAEEERIAFLQSPEGAQTVPAAATDEGERVILYEKLLPYAMIFGLEKGWSKLLGDYYKQVDTQPAWYNGVHGFNAANFASGMDSFSSATRTASASSSSSGGSSGGGFSGGGGGGGGGGGW